ncbi:MAG: TraR/DksA family transcriptional regulator [Bacteroidota bacterium]
MNANNSSVSEKTRYSDAELSEFKAIVEKKLRRAKDQFDYIHNQMKDLADNPDAKIRGLDDATGVREVEQLNSAAARLQKHVQHLENALIRIDNKVYGICRMTGKLISKQRLKAVPHATLCIEAKQSR